MAIARWMSERIEQEADAWLERAGAGNDSLVAAARRLRAWPVYADIGGALLIDGGGEVHALDHNTMEVGPEPDPNWRTVAWVAAAERVPELRAALPARPDGAVDCSECEGSGKVRLTGARPAGCGRCWGLGWLDPG